MEKARFNFFNRLKSFSYAWNGFRILFLQEHNARVHLSITCLVIAAGFYFSISRLEWVSLIFCIGFVLCTETINTAIEQVCNKIEPKQNPIIAKVKDLAAAAVLIAAISAAIVGLIVFLPKIFS